MSGSDAFFKFVEARRTYYGLKAESPISDEKIVEIVRKAVRHTPSSFNIQASRAVVFFGDKHHKVWDTVAETFLSGLPEDQREAQKGRFPGFKAAYASVAIFEDQTIIEGMQKNMPAMAQSFPTWSEDASAMLQYVIWTALEAEGFGANLQHYFSYSPAIPTAVQKAFDIPESWKCTAIIPFGVPVGEPGNPAHPKTFDKLEERVRVIS